MEDCLQSSLWLNTNHLSTNINKYHVEWNVYKT